MAPPICDAVSGAFYEGRLRTCRKARRDLSWQLEREPIFVDGFQFPHLATVEGEEPSNWSKTYGGAIRNWSAVPIALLIDHFAGAYIDASDILVLTPFRAQRTLIHAKIRRARGMSVDVTTVHRAQGGERRIVLFNPVDASSPFLSGKSGQRLIKVAASRAMAHLIVFTTRSDRSNLHLENLIGSAPRLPFDAEGQFRFR